MAPPLLPLPQADAPRAILSAAGASAAGASAAGAPRLSDAERSALEAALREVRSASTRRAYRAGWARWAAWAAGHETLALPASSEALAAWVADGGGEPRCSPRTLGVYLAGVRLAHSLAGLPDPTLGPVREALRGFRAISASEPPRQKTALDRDGLRQIVALLPRDPETLEGREGLRDRALLACGWAGGFRRSEICALTLDRVEWRPDALIVSLTKSKTNRRGAVERIPLAVDVAEPDLCPGATLKAWLAASQIKSGAIFRCWRRGAHVWGPEALSPKHLLRLVHELTAGLEGDWGAHSLRAGMITQALRNGATIEEVQVISRHKSIEVLLGYRREVDPLRGSAASKLLGRR